MQEQSQAKELRSLDWNLLKTSTAHAPALIQIIFTN